VTDFKWDGQMDTLKLLALPFQKIRSLRELNGSHLSLLKNIRDAGTAAISKKFNIPVSQLRIYFHYQPSYYYLHVHFCYLMFEAPGKLLHKTTSLVSSTMLKISDRERIDKIAFEQFDQLITVNSLLVRSRIDF